MFFFDNVGDPYLDTAIPVLNTASVVSSTELDLQFSEVVDQTTAETLGNYSVDGGIGGPSAAVLDGGDASIVHLSFATPFTNGNSYVLTANNVEDLGGNSIMNPSTANFSYLIPCHII